MRVGIGAVRRAVPEAHDVALRLERELELAALAHQLGEQGAERPEALDVLAACRPRPTAAKPR